MSMLLWNHISKMWMHVLLAMHPQALGTCPQHVCGQVNLGRFILAATQIIRSVLGNGPFCLIVGFGTLLSSILTRTNNWHQSFLAEGSNLQQEMRCLLTCGTDVRWHSLGWQTPVDWKMSSEMTSLSCWMLWITGAMPKSIFASHSCLWTRSNFALH